MKAFRNSHYVLKRSGIQGIFVLFINSSKFLKIRFQNKSYFVKVSTQLLKDTSEVRLFFPDLSFMIVVAKSLVFITEMFWGSRNVPIPYRSYWTKLQILPSTYFDDRYTFKHTDCEVMSKY